MRDQLIGYLLDALEPSEHEQVESQLRRDPQLARELELLAHCLRPLAADKAHFEPPVGLAERACQAVHERSARVAPVPAPVHAPRQWSMADMVVAAGIFLAASLLFFPAMNQSRFAARLTGCKNNLRQVGLGLDVYSEMHGGFFPNVPIDDRQCGAAGVVVVRLADLGILREPNVVLCPGSDDADHANGFHIPTFKELRAAQGAALTHLHRTMGGSYGFNLGYVSNGKYYSPKNLHRARFALVADAPSIEAPYHSLNHGGCGQNVLFEDGHVGYLTTCRAHGCRDDIYTNDSGAVRPGLHMHDSVLGPSHAQPQVEPIITLIRTDDAK
jgi:hypothetical protein